MAKDVKSIVGTTTHLKCEPKTKKKSFKYQIAIRQWVHNSNLNQYHGKKKPVR